MSPEKPFFSRALAALLLLGAGVLACTVYWQPWSPSFVAARSAHLDGIYYYAYLRSLGFDGDLDLANDYQLLGNPWHSPINASTHKFENMFGIGPALLWSPAFAVARAWLASPDGMAEGFQRWVFFASCLYGLAAVVMSYALALRAYRPSDAVFAALATLFGTPLFWYMTRDACYSHAVSAFGTALLAWVWVRTHGSWARARWFALGVLCGFNMAVRFAGIAHAALPLLELLSGQREQRRERWIAFASFALGMLLGFLPQLIAWKLMFGTFWTIPQGSHFMMWSSSRYLTVLFSTRGGWTAIHPLVSVGLLGLIAASVRSSLPVAIRQLARASLIAIALLMYLNGATDDWYAGWAFGGRRFTDCTPYVALGVAQAFALLGHRELHAWLSRTLRVALPALTVVTVGWFSYDLSEHYLRGELVDHPLPMLRYWKSAIERAVEGTYALTGNLGSIPENWWFASMGGVSPARWDVSGTFEMSRLTNFPFPFFEPWVGLAGFGDEVEHGGKRCRWLLGPEGTFTFVQRRRQALHARVKVVAKIPGAHMQLSMDGQTLLDTDVDTHMRTYEFDIPKARVITGNNFVRVKQTFPPSETHEIGQTGVKLAHDVSARSAGWAVGMIGSVAVDGVSKTAGAHGVTMFHLDGSDTHENFDTLSEPTAARRFAEAVDALAPGQIVAVVAVDEASSLWNEQADAALRALGGMRSLRKAFRASYALIGVKGAKPGTAIESFSMTHAVHATLGRPYAKAIRGTIWHELWLSPARK
ncbi:MAG TPA: interleukin-like EMT inducer domain-containing protein [Polyangiales bacterium]